MMRILIADKFQEAYLEELNSLGHKVELKPDLKAEDLPKEIVGYDVLIVRSTKVKEDVITASDKLSLIIRAGAGVNTIDIEAAADKGVFVCNTPGKNSVAVAELAFGLMLSIDRKIADCTHDLKKKVWNKKKYSKADGIFGKTLGIIGLGEIGIAFADRAKAFGMKVLAYDPIAQHKQTPKVGKRLEDRLLSFCPTVEELVKTSDVITIHVPSNPHTKGMVNKDFLKHMKPNSVLINTSRGNIVDDKALIKAMDEKNIMVGLDVYNDECATATGEFETPLSMHPNVYGTHHIGASTEQAQNAIAAEVIEILKNYEKGIVIHPVNMEMEPAVKHTVIMRVFDRVGVLAAALLLLKEQGINLQQMEGRVFSGENAQQIILHVNKCPDEATIEEIRGIDNIIQVDVKSTVESK
jgi:D-3-phosphoglycerate dehydrogenase / 2-oxoglutarate reductase